MQRNGIHSMKFLCGLSPLLPNSKLYPFSWLVYVKKENGEIANIIGCLSCISNRSHERGNNHGGVRYCNHTNMCKGFWKSGKDSQRIALVECCQLYPKRLSNKCGEVGCSNTRIWCKRWEIFSGLWVYFRNMSSCHQEYRQLCTLMKSCAVCTNFVLEIIHKFIPLLSLQLPVVHDASVVASSWLSSTHRADCVKIEILCLARMSWLVGD